MPGVGVGVFVGVGNGTPLAPDPITLDWVDRGGSATNEQLLARSAFWRTIRGDGLGTLDALTANNTTNRGRFNLMTGDALSSVLLPDLVGAGDASDTNHNFTEDDYTTAGGLEGNGSTKYLDTGLAADNFTTANVGLCAVISGKTGSAGSVIGAVDAASALPLSFRYASQTILSSRAGDDTATANLTVVTNSGSLIHLTGNTATSLYTSQGSTDGPVTTTDRSAMTHTTRDLYLFADNTAGTATGFLAANIGAYGIGFALNAAQKASLFSALTTYFAAIGRTFTTVVTPITTIFEDDFVLRSGEVAGRNLVGHKANDLIETWALDFGAATNAIIPVSGTMRPNSTATYRTSTSIAARNKGEYRRRFLVKSLTGQYGVSCRVDTGAITWVWVSYTATSNSVKIQHRVNNGTVVTDATVVLGSTPAAEDIVEIGARQNDNGDIEALWNGEVVLTANVPSGTLSLTGKFGVIDTLAPANETTGMLSTRYVAQDSTAPPTLTLTSPVFEDFFCRDITDGIGDILISGDMKNIPAGVEVTVIARFAGRDWQTIASNLENNDTFSGYWSGVYGDGDVEVAIAENIGSATAYITVADVAIGDQLGIGGQSNNSGRGDEAQAIADFYNGTKKAYLLDNAYVIRECTAPFDTSTGQVDSVSADADADSAYAFAAQGMLMERLRLLGKEVPLMLVPCARGSRPSDLFKPALTDPTTDRTTLHGSACYRLNRRGGMNKVLCIYIHQGESGTSTYYDDWKAASDSWFAEFGIRPMLCLLQNSPGQSAPAQAIIRAAAQQLIAEGNALQGPDFFNVIPCDDDFHFITKVHIDEAADMLADLILPLILAVPNT